MVLYSLGVYQLNQWEGMEHPPGHCSKTATLPSKKREVVGAPYQNTGIVICGWLLYLLKFQILVGL